MKEHDQDLEKKRVEIGELFSYMQIVIMTIHNTCVPLQLRDRNVVSSRWQLLVTTLPS
jgi:hypothetical protein